MLSVSRELPKSIKRSHALPVLSRYTHALRVKPRPPPTIPVRETALRYESLAPVKVKGPSIEQGGAGDGGGPVAVAPASGSSARRKNSVADRVLHGDVLLFERYLAFDIFGLSVMIVVVIARKAEQRVETARSEAERRRERTVKENGCIRR